MSIGRRLSNGSFFYYRTINVCVLRYMNMKESFTKSEVASLLEIYEDELKDNRLSEALNEGNRLPYRDGLEHIIIDDNRLLKNLEVIIDFNKGFKMPQMFIDEGSIKFHTFDIGKFFNENFFSSMKNDGIDFNHIVVCYNPLVIPSVKRLLEGRGEFIITSAYNLLKRTNHYWVNVDHKSMAQKIYNHILFIPKDRVFYCDETKSYMFINGNRRSGSIIDVCILNK